MLVVASSRLLRFLQLLPAATSSSSNAAFPFQSRRLLHPLSASSSSSSASTLFPLLRKILRMEVYSAQSPPEMHGLVEQGIHGSAQEQMLVQYIVVRTDLMRNLKWPMGSVISQACHAAVAAIWLYKDDQKTMQYCNPENLQNMRKVTLEVDGEAQLLKLAQNLENASILYKLWTEQPENIPTCLATKPYCKAEVAVFFKKLKLFK